MRQIANSQNREVEQLLLDGDKQGAIALLRSMLVQNPDDLDSLVQLGKLQFLEPDRPVNNLVKSLSKYKASEVVIEVRNPCNYRCHYCVAIGRNNVPVQKLDLAKIEATLKSLSSDVCVISLECEGGEPTIHPQFKSLIAICTKYGVVSFPTNNSQDPSRWLPREHSERLFIRSALHPEAEEKLDVYINNAKYLIEAGCTFSAIFIAHPERMKKANEYCDFFKSHEVPFSLSAFIGEYNGEKYPHSYSHKEKEMLGLLYETTYWAHKIQPHTNRIRNFKGIPCVAGYKSVYITKNGGLRRCLYDRTPLEAPLKGASPCKMKQCGCGLLLDKLNTVEAVDMQTYWAEKMGKAPIDFSSVEALARKSGYATIDEALSAEGLKTYEAYMAAFEKET